MLVEVDVEEIHKGILTLHTVFDAPNCLQQIGKTQCRKRKKNVEHGDCAMKATRRICR